MSDHNPQAALFKALATAQAEIKNPEKTKTAKVKGVSRKTGKPFEMTYKYADIADVLRGALPVIAKHGLSLYQPTSIKDGWIVLHTHLMHAQGGSLIGSEWPVCPVGADDQDKGKAMTYSRRYTACAALGIAAEEDVDGAEPGDRTYDPRPAPTPKPSPQIDTERAALIDNNLAAVGKTADDICKAYKVDALTDLTEAQADQIEARIKKLHAAQASDVDPANTPGVNEP